MFSAKWLLVILVMLLASTVNADDPTRPSFYKQKSIKKSFQLESILISQKRKVTVINGQVLSEGESVDGATVVKIDKDRVRLKRGAGTVDLILHSATIRQAN